MRILLCDRLTPDGPASGRSAVAIEAGLRVVGHVVEQILLPYFDDLASAPKQLMAFRLMQMTDWCDHLITLGAPAHVLDHPSKVIWCQNEPQSLRGGGQARPDHRPAWLRTADAVGFGQAAAVYATTRRRTSNIRHSLWLAPFPGGRRLRYPHAKTGAGRRPYGTTAGINRGRTQEPV